MCCYRRVRMKVTVKIMRYIISLPPPPQDLYPPTNVKLVFIYYRYINKCTCIQTQNTYI